ncbi:MAG: periplasmic heavy metal sensor [Ectothiorhodospiraceae bacterium]|nr:periplasmic heavy metal sensor [Ectothiorhodospiraceae bacterium]MCH8503864.1 periplasmic heavy metal sensor [Ectothiorhodospiraceae bacterium]
MKTKLLISSLILGLAVSGSALAGQHHGENRQGGHMEHRIERMAKHLELDASQQEQIKAAFQAHGPELRELRTQIREQARELRGQRDSFNEETARAQADRLGELTAQAAFIGARMQSDIHAVLSEEQRQKIAERMENHKQRWGHRGERRGHRGGERGDRS